MPRRLVEAFKHKTVRQAVGILLLATCYTLLAAAVLDTFVARHHLATRGDSGGKTFAAIIGGDLERPYAYRVLTPLVITEIARLLPEPVADAATTYTARLRPAYKLAKGHDVEYAVAFVLIFACLMATLFAWRSLVRRAYPGAGLLADITPAAALLLYALLLTRHGYLWDIPELLLVSVLLLLFGQRRWWLYYPVFGLALLNWEASAVVITWCVAAWICDRERRWLSVHLPVHIAIASAAVAATHVLLANVPGDAIRLHYYENLVHLVQFRTYLATDEPFAVGIPGPWGLNILLLALLAGVVFVGWSGKPRLDRLIFCLTTAALVPLWFIGGVWDELRVFTPAIPPLVVLLAGTICDLRPQGQGQGQGQAVLRS